MLFLKSRFLKLLCRFGAPAAALVVVAGCGDNTKPTAHEPDADPEEVAPERSEPPATVQRAPTPPPSATPAPPPPLKRPADPPPAPVRASSVDPLDPPAPPRPGASNLRPVEGPETFPETVPPVPPDAGFPAGVTVLEEERPATATSVKLQVDDGDLVVIHTKNVKRMRIHRARLGAARDRSVVLRIDDQGIEWTRDVEVVELERSRNGEWTVFRVRP